MTRLNLDMALKEFTENEALQYCFSRLKTIFATDAKNYRRFHIYMKRHEKGILGTKGKKELLEFFGFQIETTIKKEV